MQAERKDKPVAPSVNEGVRAAALPKSIGGYKVETLLSRGGTSVLYLAIHPETQEPLAIKVLDTKYLSHPSMVERFLKEAEIIELTCHPNIIKLFGHGKWEGGLYIAMEFVQGISLRQMILQEAMSLKRALEIILQIAYALTHLHAHGIIHRDLKPENILLTAQGGVKVIDFGISQIYNQPPTQVGAAPIVGTPAYMSPEQRKDPLNVSFATDIYSLGILTYELVLGRLSYGEVHLSLMPRGLQKILAKALQPKIEDRWEDIVDFVQALSKYLGSKEFQKDRRGADYVGELSESLREAQSFLIPQELPQWPRAELALASNYNGALSSVYFDFLQHKEGVYQVIMGESLSTGVEGLLQIAMLKGMVRALAHTQQLAKEWIPILNARILEDRAERIFSLAVLTLTPAQERLSYVACGYSPLWYLPVGADTPRRLGADNLALGIVEELDVIEVEGSWNVGDRLVMHTFQAGRRKHIEEIEKDEGQFLEALMGNVFLAPKKQAEAIFRRLTQGQPRAFSEKSVTVISMARLA